MPYQIAAIGEDYGHGPSSEISYASTAILVQPEIQYISTVSEQKLKLIWTKVTGASGYRIERSEIGPDSGYDWSQTVERVTEMDLSVPSDRTYYFRIAGLIGDQIGPFSAPIAGSTNAIILTQPTIESITRVSDLNVNLSWTSVPGATGYKIWRADWDNNHEWLRNFSWSTTVGNVTETQISVPQAGYYYFKVAAMLDEAEGPQSSVSSISTSVFSKMYITRIASTVDDNYGNKNLLCIYWNQDSNATDFRIWRSEIGPDTGFSWVKTIDKDAYPFCDPVTSQEPYYYIVAR